MVRRGYIVERNQVRGLQVSIDPRDKQQIIAEVGVKASTFPSAAEFTSWVGTCPGKEESAEENSSSRSANDGCADHPTARASRARLRESVPFAVLLPYCENVRLKTA
jgi:hypothetical protein